MILDTTSRGRWEEFIAIAKIKGQMDTYVQAVTDEKREAQNKVVKMLLPGIRRVISLKDWIRDEMASSRK